MTHSIDRKHDDYLVRATAKDGLLRCFAVRTNKLVERAREIHDLPPMSTVALGRLMTGALLMSTDLKNDTDSLDVIIRSDGPIGGLTAGAFPGGRVRGTVGNPRTESLHHRPGKLNVGAAVGKGTLTVIKDLGLKEPYSGSIDLLSGEIAEDLAAYYFYSEQIPTVMMLGVKVGSDGTEQAGGLMVQVMPGADDELLDWLGMRAAGYPEITSFLEDGFDPHQLIDLLLGDPELKYGDAYPVEYFCPCSRERMERSLIALGARDLSELAEKPEGIELECHFCHRKEHFSQDDIKKIQDKQAGGDQ